MNKIYKSEDSLIFQNKFFDLETGTLLSPVETQNYNIVQVAESYFGSSFDIPPHRQPCDAELTFVLTGEMVCCTGNKTDTLNKHEVYLSFKNDTHALWSHKKCRFQTLAFNVKTGPCREMLLASQQKFGARRTVFLPETAPLLSAVVAEFIGEGLPFSRNHLDSMLSLILVKLLRSDEEGVPTPTLSPEEKLTAVITYLDLHFLTIGSLEELSVRFGYTYSHLCKLFRAAYGVTPGAYLAAKKLDHSVLLLRKGQTLGEIAEALGYSTPYNFSRAFKNRFGVSPRAYKEREDE